MTDYDGDGSAMPHSRFLTPDLELDAPTAEGLIDGTVDPDGAPAPFVPVARLLATAAGPTQAHELDDEPSAVAMFARERRSVTPITAAAGGRRPSPRRRNAKVAAIAVFGTLALTGGAAAAATGHLPPAVQGFAHDALTRVGLSIPDSAATNEPPQGPGQDGTPGGGQGDGSGQDEPLGRGDEIAPTATDPTTSGQDKGQAVCAEASDGACDAGQDGEAGNPQSGVPGGPAPSGRGTPTGPPESPGQSGEHPPATPTTPAPQTPGPPTSNPGNPGGPPAKTPAGPPASSPAATVPSTPGR